MVREVVPDQLDITVNAVQMHSVQSGGGFRFSVCSQVMRGMAWNTYVSLDMIFLDENLFVVDVIACAVPLSLEQRESYALSRYVVELRCGTAAAHGLRVGDQVWLRAQ